MGAPQRMPALNIPAEHPDAENPLLRTCAQALLRLGADVWVRHGADNAIRMAVSGDRARPFAPRAPAPMPAWPVHEGPAVARVEVEGLPNLLHELVHIALAGTLADDHGYDYRAIPYDLATVAGRSVLWEEIACCVVSCAWLAGSDSNAMDTMHAWFAEQLGIQPLFYGMEDAPAIFFDRVDELARVHADERLAMIACAHERVAGIVGATPPARVGFDELWSHWRGGGAVG